MNVEIRVARLEDVPRIQAIYAPYCTDSCVSFEVAAPTVPQMHERVQRIGLQYPWLVGLVSGEVAGYVYASQHRERAAYRWAVDVAVYVDGGHQRRGLGRALYTSLFALLRLQGYYQAYAGISLPNAASVGLHEALHFEPVAVFPHVGYKKGRWLDVGWWRLKLAPERDNPTDPVPFSAMLDDDGVATAIAEGIEQLSVR